MGLLEQPHTSAGRVPSHLGYRLYINRLMQPKPVPEEEQRYIDSILTAAADDRSGCWRRPPRCLRA